MHKFIIAGIAVTTCLFSVQDVQATDILSQDSEAHVLIITEDEMERIVDIEAMGEIRDVCNGCTITLEDGQSITAKANDIVAIIDGKLIADE